jgi:Pro-kumamolisin, activation domain
MTRPGELTSEETLSFAWDDSSLSVQHHMGCYLACGPKIAFNSQPSRRLAAKGWNPFVEHQLSSETTHTPSLHWGGRLVMLLSSVLMTVAAIVGMAVTTTSAATPAYQSISQTVAPQIATAKVTGATSPSQKLTLGITLKSKNQAGLKAFVEQVSDPKSKLHNSFLTSSQFKLAFGADSKILNLMESYLQSHGIHVDEVDNGGLYIRASGTVTQAQDAFKVHINNYQAQDGRVFFANAENLQVPSSLAPSILDIAGTETGRFSVAASEQGKQLATPAATLTCPTSAGSYATPFTPAALQKAYGMSTSYSNASASNGGQTIALVAFDGFNYSTDIQPYLAACASAAVNARVNAVPTGTLTSALTPGTGAFAVESNIELLAGLVPNIGAINVYEGTNTTVGIQSLLAKIANDSSAQTVIYPYGMCEPDLGFAAAQAEQIQFMTMAAQGQTVFASSGDTGAYACYAADGLSQSGTRLAVMDPASDPFVVAVGGTTLALNPATGAITSEVGWNTAFGATNAPLKASGGGVSTFWGALGDATSGQSLKAATTSAVYNFGIGKAVATAAATGYSPTGVQTGVTGSPARVVPDVAANANSVAAPYSAYCTVGGCAGISAGFTSAGGTSEGAVIWGALNAITNGTSPSGSTSYPRLGLITPALYALYNVDIANAGAQGAGVATAGFIQPVAGGTKYCDYANVINGDPTTKANFAFGTTATAAVACNNATGNVFNAITSGPAGITSVGNGGGAVTMVNAYALGNTFNNGGFAPTQNSNGGKFPMGYNYNISGYTQAAVLIDTALTGGYNAVTGLGTPTSNAIAYLSNTARFAIARAYMVGANTGTNPTYWIASYVLNPYVSNGPTYTQWTQLGTNVFRGQPAIVDNSAVTVAGLYTQNGGAAYATVIPTTQVWIAGLNSSGQVVVIQWTPSSNQVSTSLAAVSSLPSGVTCAGATSAVVAPTKQIGAAPGAGTAYGTSALYLSCTGTNNSIYMTYATLSTPVTGGVTYQAQFPTSWPTSGTGFWSAIGGGATSGASITYRPLTATTGTIFSVVQAPTGSGDSSIWSSSISLDNTLDTSLSVPTWTRLSTSCNSSPAVAWNALTTSYNIACIDTATHTMYANSYNTTTTTWTGWVPLGSPSASVTFQAGAGVAVDNTGFGTGYPTASSGSGLTANSNWGQGITYYVGLGSDGSMYLKYVEPSSVTVANALNNTWQGVATIGGVPVTGIFSTPAGIDYVNQ